MIVIALAVPRAVAAQGKIQLPVSIAELERRVKADSTDAVAHYNVALGYWSTKKWPDVDRELRTAVRLEPRLAVAHLALAYLPLARNPHLYESIDRNAKQLPKDVLAAENQRVLEYRHAFLIDPMVDLRIIAANSSSPDYWLVHDALSEELAAYVEGLADCQEGRYADCENNLAIFIKAFGNSVRAKNFVPATTYFYHGIAAAHLAHYSVAIADFNLLIERDSVAVRKAEEKQLVHFPIRSNEYRYFIGVFEQAAGRTAEAGVAFRTALENDLSLYIAHVRLAEMYEAAKDLRSGVEERRNAVNANPDDASLQIDLGVTLGRAGQFAEARDALLVATERLPVNADAWFWLGVANQQLGRAADARVDYENVVRFAPSRLQGRVTAAKQRLASLP